MYRFFQRPQGEPRPKPTILLQAPKLQVLDDIVAVTKAKMPELDFSKTAIFAVQHHLESTLSLYEALQTWGVALICSTGKTYSTCAQVEEAMIAKGIKVITYPAKGPGHFYEALRSGIEYAWEVFLKDIKELDIDTIIILDDGGRAIELMPPALAIQYKIIGVEQTRAGLNSEKLKIMDIPIIQVASAALKKILEPPLIATAAFEAATKIVPRFQPDGTQIFGVIGLGIIGEAMKEYLLAQGYLVIVYDARIEIMDKIRNTTNCRKAKTIEEVFIKSHYVFGCTGTDITAGIAQKLLRIIDQEVVLLSLSSEEKEYKSLIDEIMGQHRLELPPLADIIWRTNNFGKITIVGGGTPVNFLVNSRLGQSWSVPSIDMAIIRGALLSAIIQAQYVAQQLHSSSHPMELPLELMLDPYLQSFVLSAWRKTPHSDYYNEELFEQLTPDAIMAQSGGDYQEQPLLQESFSLPETTQCSHTP